MGELALGVGSGRVGIAVRVPAKIRGAPIRRCEGEEKAHDDPWVAGGLDLARVFPFDAHAGTRGPSQPRVRRPWVVALHVIDLAPLDPARALVEGRHVQSRAGRHRDRKDGVVHQVTDAGAAPQVDEQKQIRPIGRRRQAAVPTAAERLSKTAVPD